MIALRQPADSEGFVKDLIPDLTPMLDILFILLVFFMLSVGQVFESMDLTLPESTAQKVQQAQMEDMLILSLGGGENSYAINDQEFESVQAFKTEILKTVQDDPERQIILAGDRSVSLERLLTILTFLNDNGIQTANILMQSGDQK